MRRLFLFAAYDAQGIVGPSLVEYVRILSLCGDVVLVMDNEPAEGQMDSVAPYTLHCSAVRHGEYDFGSYKRAFAWAAGNSDLKDYDFVYLVNDSVYGPFRPIQNYLDRMEALQSDAFAMVLNPHRRTPHLQSWFIGLRKSIFLSGWFAEFLGGVCPLDSKEAVCVKYETGLTELLTAHGAEYDALFRFRGRTVYNRVKACWHAGMPFIKRSAFTRHGGCLGRQIHYVLSHTDEACMAAATVDDASRLLGRKEVEDLLEGTGPDMFLRYISYLSRKILHRR